MMKEIYISVDVESDGPIPGPYSMTALGAVVAGYRTDTGKVVKLDVTSPENRFYAEIKPISDDWEPEAMKVGLFEGFGAEQAELDTDGSRRRAYILEHGQDPKVAMTAFAEWVEEKKVQYESRSAVFAAYPLGFDWMFTYWYLVAFAGVQSPFGFSKHIDIKTLFAEKANRLIQGATKRNMPKALHSKLPHTHLAIDDSAEQGELLMNIFLWEGSAKQA
jgi:hypothetical protein